MTYTVSASVCQPTHVNYDKCVVDRYLNCSARWRSKVAIQKKEELYTTVSSRKCTAHGLQMLGCNRRDVMPHRSM